DGSVRPVQAWPGVGAAQDGDLVPQHEELDVLGGGRAAHQQDHSEHLREDQVQQAQRHAGIMPNQRSPLVSDPGTTSGTPHDNRAMLKSVHAALKPNGLLVGLFPRIFAPADIGFCEERERWRLELVDLSNSRYCFYEFAKTTHILYTPLRLRAILHEAGFVAPSMEIFFCE